MITFWIVAGLMLLAALALLLRPLLVRPVLPTLRQRDANIAVYRRRLAELEVDNQAGLLDDATFAEAKVELERQLLGDLGEEGESESALRPRPARAAALGVALVVPLAAILLYLQLGSPAAVTAPQTDPALLQAQQQLAFIEQHLSDLEARVRQQPDDLEAALMLGRAYLVLQWFDAAAELYAQLEPRAGEDPVFLVDYAEALGYAQGGNLLGRPSELLQRALTVEPDSPKALWLAGIAAMQAEQPSQARRYWQTLLRVLPPDNPAAEQVRQLLQEIGPAPAAASLQVQVEVAPELAGQVPVGSTVFVLARPVDGPRTPLAVVRHPVEELPLQVVLDESMAMAPGLGLDAFTQVVVEARISRAGEAARQTGDLIGYSQPVAVAAGSVVRVVIDAVVE